MLNNNQNLRQSYKRVMWNTALPLSYNKRINNYLRNQDRVEIFEELSFYRFEDGGVTKVSQRGGRGAKSVTLVMVEKLLSELTMDKYLKIIRKLFVEKYMNARDARFAIKFCSEYHNDPLTDNEINILIKNWV